MQRYKIEKTEIFLALGTHGVRKNKRMQRETKIGTIVSRNQNRTLYHIDVNEQKMSTGGLLQNVLYACSGLSKIIVLVDGNLEFRKVLTSLQQ